MKIFSNAVTERINVFDRLMKPAVEPARAKIKSHVATKLICPEGEICELSP